jgi:hypothetical protein
MSLKLAERLATSQTWLDGVSDRLQPLVRDAVAGTGRRGADLLDGVWLAAPLHPALTDVPVGALTAAVTLGGVGLATGSRALERQADGGAGDIGGRRAGGRHDRALGLGHASQAPCKTPHANCMGGHPDGSSSRC